MHDNSEKVRIAMVELLLTVKTLPDMKYARPRPALERAACALAPRARAH